MTTATESACTRLEVGDDGIATLTLASLEGRPFILDERAVEEIENRFAELAEADGLTGVLISAEHASVFCAGADVEAIRDLDDPDDAHAIAGRGQELMDAIEQLPVPVAALVHGTCVGGGLELALACHLRIVTDDPATRLGLPEVRLGILPAWGGSTRLPELVGLRAALPMLLTGKTLDGRRALRSGLATECVPRALLERRGRARLADLAAAWHHGHHGGPRVREPSAMDYLIDEMALMRKLVLATARRQVARQTGGHYPAPRKILDVLEKGLGRSRDERLRLEREGIAELATGSVSKRLVSIFLRNRDRVRGHPYDFETEGLPAIQRVAVIGAGVMGSGIATALLLKGLDVRLVDPFPESLVKARRAIERELERRLERRRLDRWEIKRILARLDMASEVSGLARVDLVIEAVPEIPAIKKDSLTAISTLAPAGAIITTNTSSLSVEGLASHVTGASRFAGLHFFNPAPKMPLVEIVRTEQTDEETIVRLVRFCRRIGKTPVVVSDSPAFVVNRLLGPYLLEAFDLFAGGADIVDVDRAARGFGLPMGPFELMDTVGLDVVLHVCRYMAGFPEMGMTLPPLLERMVEAGRLGKKSGRGFYLAGKRGRRGKPERAGALSALEPDLTRGTSAAGLDARAVVERLTGVLAKEAEKILEEKVVTTADDLDLASIFGMGFPPFTGGIATWMREREDAE